MRVTLLNNGGYDDHTNVEFPVVVEGEQYISGFNIEIGELVKVGFVFPETFQPWETLHFINGTEAEQSSLSDSTDAPCIREMCCNQFGERDEMQSIINSLQADVIARDARIADLESRPTIEGFIDIMVDMQSEAKKSNCDDTFKVVSFTIKAAENYLRTYCRDAQL